MSGEVAGGSLLASEPLPLRFTAVTLRARGIDLEKPGYRDGWFLLGLVAERNGVEVSCEDGEHLAMNLGVMRAIDDLVDERHQTDVTDEVRRVSAGEVIEGVTPQEAEAFAEVMGGYSDQRARSQSLRLGSFPYYAERKRQATTVSSLAAVIREEAATFASLLELPRRGAPEKGHDKFNDWLRRVSVAGYFIDSYVDLREDYENGNSGVEPSTAARLGMGRRAFKEARRTLSRTPPSSLGRLVSVGRRYLNS